MKRHAINTTLTTFAATVLLASAGVSAQPQRFDFALDAARGSMDLTTSIMVNTHGFWIGDHDPVTNPGGTRTIPGLFGGSGNNPINVRIDMGVAGQTTTHPVGNFSMDVHTGAFSVDGFAIDMLAGQSLMLPLEVTLLYDTFHTASPTSLFPGGTPFTLPLGNAEVSVLTAAQSAIGGGTLTPTGNPGEYLVAGLVPVVITMEATAMGTPITPAPQPGALAIAGTLTIGFNTATLRLTSNIDVQQMLPGPIAGPQAVPFALPTILPPGGVANLLVTLDIDQIDFAFGGAIDLVASGSLACFADCDQSTGAGTLDIFDFLCFQSGFVAGDPAACGCDLSTGPTVCDIFDFLCFQSAFVGGCP
jgi:hypothetical protein